MMDWLPEDDIVHLIVDAVGVMELRRFEESTTSGPGQAAFSPAMMLALLIYAYRGHHNIREWPISILPWIGPPSHDLAVDPPDPSCDFVCLVFQHLDLNMPKWCAT